MPNYIELQKELVELIETQLTGNIICDSISTDYHSISIKLKEKDLNWIDFLTVSFLLKDGEMSITHGSGGWNESTAMQRIEAIEAMLSIAKGLNSIKDELILLSNKIETLRISFNREKEKSKVALFNKALDMISSTHDKANFKDVLNIISNGGCVTLLSVNGFKEDGVTPLTYENIVYNKGNSRLNIYFGDKNISKANLQNYIENQVYFIA